MRGGSGGGRERKEKEENDWLGWVLSSLFGEPWRCTYLDDGCGWRVYMYYLLYAYLYDCISTYT